MEQKKYVYGQSGVQGFFGRTLLLEYWYQLIYFFIPGYSFKKMVFVSKTATLKPRIGNTELRSSFKIKAFLPPSIWVSAKSFWHGYMLNAVGLSNPGLLCLLQYGLWQKRKDEYFHISLQLESSSWPEIEKEIKVIANSLIKYLPVTKFDYDLQINESCPNTEHSIAIDMDKIDETKKKLELFHLLLPDIKIWLKYNAQIDVRVLSILQPYCEGFIISNTIPFGANCGIDWKKWFKDGKSPLPKRLGKPFEGGLSGSLIFPMVFEKISEIQEKNPSLKIIAGGGIMTKHDIDLITRFSVVKGITIGTVAVLRPWKVQSLVNYANKVFENKNKLNV